MTKNYSIEFYRIVFTLIICLHHAGAFFGVDFIKHGYLCVEFFFMLTGFFLMKSFNKENTHDLFSFIAKRFKRLAPDYIFALFVLIIAIALFHTQKINFIRILLELLFLQNSGLFTMGGYNYPCWYLSVLIVGSAMIYCLLSINKRIILPVLGCLSFFGFSYIFNYLPNIENWGSPHGIYVPLLRGLVEMTFGALLAEISHNPIKNWKWSVVELICISVILYGIFRPKNIDSAVVLSMGLLIFITTKKLGFFSSILNREIFAWGGTIAYPIYVNHAFVLLVFQQFFIKYELQSEWYTAPSVILSIIVYSLFTYWFIRFVVTKFGYFKL